MQWGLGGGDRDRRADRRGDDPDGQTRRADRHARSALARHGGGNVEMSHGVPRARAPTVERRHAAQPAGAGHDPVHGAARRRLTPVARARRRGTLSGMDNGYRVAVVGATGQVGTLMLQLLRERSFPARRDRGVRLRALGRQGAPTDGLIVQGLSDESIQGFDLALFSAGGSTSGEWAPRFVGGGRDRDRQLLALAHAGRRAAGRQRGQPRGARLPPGHHRQPQLLDDADGRRAEADPRRGGHRAAGDQHLPGRVGHRQARGGRAARPVPRAAARARDRAAERLRPPDRVQRAAPRRHLRRRRGPHRRGAQADQRDAQDPRRSGDPRLRHVRARAGRQRPLRGRQRADARASSLPSAPASCWPRHPA